MSHAIETMGLSRRFGQTEAVHDLTMRVPTGSVCALVGPNGAGKTTTIRLLMRLVDADAGTARVLGSDARRLGPELLARIGYVSESQELHAWMTVDDLCAYCAPFYRTWDRDLARGLCRLLDLPRNRPVGGFSRGMRMKAALLVSLAFRPELLLMDEPFTGLDPLVREEISQGMLDVAGERTTFIASHEVDEIERLADHVAFIDGGRLQFMEPTTMLLARFRDVEVVFDGDARLPASRPATWLVAEVCGRSLRFVDSAHDEAGLAAQVAHHVPGARLAAVDPKSLRSIVVSLARASRTAHQEA